MTRALITGSRIYLRKPAPRDEAELLGLTRSSRQLHHPWIAAPLTRVAFQRYLTRIKRPDCLGLFVCRKSDRAIVGVFNLAQIYYGNFKSAYLGYYTGAEFAGKGYMSEGLELVVRHSFRRLKLHRIEANIQPANGQSIKLVKRAGFRKEGFSKGYLKILNRWRDHERWAIVAV